MRFLVDAQLPPALARWLDDRGQQAEHVWDCGLTQATDAETWEYAAQAGAVLVTKDEEFAERRASGHAGPPIVWISLNNTRCREFLNKFESILPELLAALDGGEVLIEIM